MAECIRHPARITWLMLLKRDGRLNAVEVMREMGLKGRNLQRVAYHGRRLAHYRAIELVDSDEVNGGTQRIYALTPFGKGCLGFAVVISRDTI